MEKHPYYTLSFSNHWYADHIEDDWTVEEDGFDLWEVTQRLAQRLAGLQFAAFCSNPATQIDLSVQDAVEIEGQLYLSKELEGAWKLLVAAREAEKAERKAKLDAALAQKQLEARRDTYLKLKKEFENEAQ